MYRDLPQIEQSFGLGIENLVVPFSLFESKMIEWELGLGKIKIGYYCKTLCKTTTFPPLLSKVIFRTS